MKDFSVSVVQMDCSPGNISSNLEHAYSLLKNRHSGGAGVVVLPELFNTGYDLDLIGNMEYRQNSTIRFLQNTAREFRLTISAGILEEEAGKRYNSVLVIDPEGKTVQKYRKMHLFPGSESDLFDQGKEPVLFSIESLEIGVMICFDIRFPELSRKLCQKGAVLILISSAFPLSRLEHWNTLIKARAIENQCYIAASNRTGQDGETVFAGNSAIIDPWGDILCRAGEKEETVLYGKIDSGYADEVRKILPCRIHPALSAG